MASYRSLVPGGFYSPDPNDKKVPVSIRFNNPGAVNGASWERTYPGYCGEIETTPGNRSTIFETPEQGIAVYWDLLRRYRASGVTTVGGIINRYGGGQDYSAYVKQVMTWTGLTPETEIKLYGDDALLLNFAKGMFRYECGRIPPWKDEQIIFGFGYGRTQFSGAAPTVTPAAPPPPTPVAPQPVPPIEPALIRFLRAIIEAIFGKVKRPAPEPLAPIRILKKGMSGNDVLALQRRLVEIGYTDLVTDGKFADVMDTAIRSFQTARNLDPDGEVGPATLSELLSPDAHRVRPPLMPPPVTKVGVGPPWYVEGCKWIGFHEIGDNHGIEKFIANAKCGNLGDAWCAIWINSDLETTGIPGTKSAAARSFEKHPGFVKLKEPCLGCITTMWRISPENGSGHVFLYDGENSKGVRGIAGNENDEVKRSFHERSRITGYWWPKSVPLPSVMGAIAVADAPAAAPATSET